MPKTSSYRKAQNTFAQDESLKLHKYCRILEFLRS
jgi:hypothetical protein